MRRVVVTGMGIVSCLGNSLDEAAQSLKSGKSGIRFNETYREMGFRSQIAGSVDVDTDVIDRKIRRFMGPSAMYSFLSLAPLLVIAIKRGSMKYALPYGTFLALAAVGASLWGQQIVTWYTGLYYQ